MEMKPFALAPSDSNNDKTMTAGRHRLGTFTARCALVLAAVLGGACSSETESPSSSLTVQIDAPEGAKIDVEVGGPNGFKKIINSTTTFSDIAPGQYRVALVESRKRITRATIDDTFVGTVDQPEPRVTLEPAKVVITFEKEPGSGHVWIPIAKEDKVVAFSATAFEQKTRPSFELTTPAGSGPDAVAFRLGDLWVAFRDSGQVAQYDAMVLTREASPKPAKIISNLGRPSSLAFDKSGDLFIAEASKRTVARFTTLATKPSLANFTRIDGSPAAIAFDAEGTMFVATTEPPAVRIFTPSEKATDRPTLRGSLIGAQTGLVAPSGLAFGADGGLWVTNGDKAPAVRFDPYVLMDAIGDIDAKPSATLAPPAGESFNGLAFDKEGQGWFTAFRAQTHDLRCGTAMQTDAPSIGPAVSLGVEKPQSFGAAMFAFNPPPVVSPIRR